MKKAAALFISYDTDYVDATGHVSSSEGIVTAPTCTEYGYTTYVCDACGESFDDYFVLLPHTDAELDYICDICGEACNISDVDNDRYTTSADARKMLRIFAGLASFSVSDDGMTANSGDSYLGDVVDLNGKITVADARLTLRISAKLETL